MSNAENKVEFNLHNVHYALLSGTASAPEWGTPVAVPGAVSLSLDPEGDTTSFYADGIRYFVSVANNGYAGDLEMARIPDQMRKDIWNETLDETDKVLVENAKPEPNAFALLYEIDGDKTGSKGILYNCTGTRPSVGSKTNEDGKKVQTQKVKLTASPLADGNVKACTTADTPQSVLNTWFTEVWQAGGTAEE